uniref:uncharacterized protein LOC122583245 n=1 Tax=Erigeron canadensis TaxID=72917 RepID=UPI001CB89F86|nr:uncharacterized protein LOC122583245 [Erigeron canadensis]
MSNSSASSSSSSDYESTEYESINRVVSQMNAVFNPEAIGTCLSKCTSAIRQLSYSYKADALEEYLKMVQDTGYQCLDAFCKCVIHLYRDEYLRRATEADIERLTSKHEQDRAPKVEFSVNGHRFGKGYYLEDGIYPEWATLVKSFKCTMDPKTTKFKGYQEAARKDVERAFEVLQGRWQIVEQQARAYSVNKIKRIMLCCVILHNMIVEENERTFT